MGISWTGGSIRTRLLLQYQKQQKGERRAHPAGNAGLIWVPDHSGIFGNEEANRLAEVSARTPLTDLEPFYRTGKCTYMKEFLEKEEAEREKLWRDLQDVHSKL